MNRSLLYTRKVLVLLLLISVAVVLALAAAGAHGQSAKTSLEDSELARRFNAISDRLVCQCSCQMVLRVCNHQNCPSAVPMRHQIEKKLLAGETDDEIVDEFVGEYGLKVLSSPPAEGLNLAAWVMPGVAVIFGLLVVGYLILSWRNRRRLALAAPGDSSTVDRAPADPALRERIERELSETE
jgi:cytochrome c-type biogenesis protein CcmH